MDFMDHLHGMGMEAVGDVPQDASYMLEGSVLSYIERISDKVVELLDPKAVILTGSFARGEATLEVQSVHEKQTFQCWSDIDLIVVTHEEAIAQMTRQCMWFRDAINTACPEIPLSIWVRSEKQLFDIDSDDSLQPSELRESGMVLYSSYDVPLQELLPVRGIEFNSAIGLYGVGHMSLAKTVQGFSRGRKEHARISPQELYQLGKAGLHVLTALLIPLGLYKTSRDALFTQVELLGHKIASLKGLVAEQYGLELVELYRLILHVKAYPGTIYLSSAQVSTVVRQLTELSDLQVFCALWGLDDSLLLDADGSQEDLPWKLSGLDVPTEASSYTLETIHRPLRICFSQMNHCALSVFGTHKEQEDNQNFVLIRGVFENCYRILSWLGNGVVSDDSDVREAGVVHILERHGARESLQQVLYARTCFGELAQFTQFTRFTGEQVHLYWEYAFEALLLTHKVWLNEYGIFDTDAKE